MKLPAINSIIPPLKQGGVARRKSVLYYVAPCLGTSRSHHALSFKRSGMVRFISFGLTLKARCLAPRRAGS